MMGLPNYGKSFEEEIKSALLRVPEIDVQRLYDTTNGFTGIKQPSDFIAYKYPYQYYIECKCHWENTIRSNHLTQIDRLREKAKIPGIVAGFMIWFIKHDRTIFVPVETVVNHIVKYNYKSINIKELDDGTLAKSGKFFEIEGKKRRVFYDYDLEKFMKEVESWMTM